MDGKDTITALRTKTLDEVFKRGKCVRNGKLETTVQVPVGSGINYHKREVICEYGPPVDIIVMEFANKGEL